MMTLRITTLIAMRMSYLVHLALTTSDTKFSYMAEEI